MIITWKETDVNRKASASNPHGKCLYKTKYEASAGLNTHSARQGSSYFSSPIKASAQSELNNYMWEGTARS